MKRNQRTKGNRTHGWVAAVAALMLLIPAIAWAVNLPAPSNALNDPQFEVEGNLLSETAGKLDWADGGPGDGVINAVRNADGTCTQTGSFALGGPGVNGTGSLVCDGSQGNFADQNGFSMGSHEETGNNPQPWNITAAGSPKKADLAEVYIYGKIFDSAFDDDDNSCTGPNTPPGCTTNVPGEIADDLMFVFDLTRLDVNGDTHADFEFNKLAQIAGGTGSCPASATVCQPRGAGDVIVSFDLPKGGANPTTTFYVFRTALGSGEVCANAPQASIDTGGCYVEVQAPAAVSGEPAAIAFLNTGEIPAAPWKTVGCEKTTDDPTVGCRLRTNVPAKGNMEGFVDLTAFFGDNFSLCPGFAQATAKTRSSKGLNASLQDTTAPIPINASVCSLLIKKFAADGSTLLPGATFTISPNPFTRATGSSLAVADGGTNDQADGNDGVVCLDNVQLGALAITETGVPNTYFGDTSTKNVTIGSSATCAQRLAGGNAAATADASFTNRKGSIIIRKEDAGHNPVAGAVFTITPNPLTGLGSLDITDNGTNDAFNTTGGLICVDNVVNLANTTGATATQFSIVEKTPPPGFFPDPSTKTVSVTAPSTCAGRGTGGTPDATFVNKKASLVIRKVAKNKNATGGIALFTGATFTITPNPLTGTGSLDVTDNGANDAFNLTGGMICINNVVNLGTGNSYSIVEKSANNPNYTKDGTTKTVLSSALPQTTCAARSTAAGGDANVTPNVAAFINTPLSRIEVIFTSSAGAGVTVGTIVCTNEGGGVLPFTSGPTPDLDKVYTGLPPNSTSGNYTCTIHVDP